MISCVGPYLKMYSLLEGKVVERVNSGKEGCEMADSLLYIKESDELMTTF